MPVDLLAHAMAPKEPSVQVPAKDLVALMNWLSLAREYPGPYDRKVMHDLITEVNLRVAQWLSR